MSLAEEVELLRRIPMFANVETSKLKLLAFTSERVAFHAGDVLFSQNEMGNSAYIIISGEADVTVDTPAGPLVVAHVGRNDFIGEIAILGWVRFVILAFALYIAAPSRNFIAPRQTDPAAARRRGAGGW